MDIKAVAALNIQGIRETAEELSRLKGWNLKSVAGALRCVPMIVKRVEDIGKLRELTGAEKQELAVELVLQLAPLPWWLPISVAKPLLAAVVDMAVSALKDRF